MMTDRGLVTFNAFLIQKRNFKNSSLIASFFIDEGELLQGIVYQGQKKKLMPFQPYFIGVYKREGLSKVTQIEGLTAPFSLTGAQLFCGFYINELMGRLARGLQGAKEIYLAYQRTIEQLNKPEDYNIERSLRLFEFYLFKHLGYGLDFCFDSLGQKIIASKTYSFIPERGFVSALEIEANRLLGKDILKLASLNLSSDGELRLAKYINRLMVDYLLEGQPLVSRTLFN